MSAPKLTVKGTLKISPGGILAFFGTVINAPNLAVAASSTPRRTNTTQKKHITFQTLTAQFTPLSRLDTSIRDVEITAASLDELEGSYVVSGTIGRDGVNLSFQHVLGTIVMHDKTPVEEEIKLVSGKGRGHVTGKDVDVDVDAVDEYKNA